ncbi:HD-GYP domain-containing protein [Paenibacillus piri]|uniref:HD-GYP domain-containing protein n=1 Tax=Paenibacillus piri TaxID=2547395 RepID=A0A4R5KNF1_9BACL|nr:HD-GYP domain-containing protein [Paenibacillus piri]TDF96187.1 HD-GYP domain-containing protein [Paenibacillus piri]
MNERQLLNKVGYKVNKDLLNSRGVVVIPEQTILQEQHVEWILNHGISPEEQDFENPQTITSDPLVTQASEMVKDMFHLINEEKEIPIEELNRSVIPTIYRAAEFPSLFSVLSGLQAKDDYTYRHNIGVGVISTLIGKWLHLSKDELSLLSTAATLHDVGKIRIDDDILNKPGKYSNKEYEMMQNHTLYGFEIIKRTPNLPPQLALVALQHHEREDGNGYPNGLKGGQIEYFSKIVAVADIFHAMTSKRVYKDAMPFYRVVRQMQQDSFGQLDPVICGVFISRMMELAVGDEVILTDGRRGLIMNCNPLDLTNPLVRVGDEYIDLSRNGQLFIQTLVG